MRAQTFTPEFVGNVPESLAAGVLYVCIAYATVAHLCCCGCGNEVITPLTPTDWSLNFDGETVSLTPSIGNWGFDCKSHYVLCRNRVDWAPTWSQAQIARNRLRDRAAKVRHYDGRDTTVTGSDPVKPESPTRWAFASRFWRRMRPWACGFRR